MTGLRRFHRGALARLCVRALLRRLPIIRLAAIALVGGLAVGGGTGCSSYSYKALRVRDPLAAGDYPAAVEFLEEEKPGGDGLPYLMELGLVLRERGDLARSNQVFEEAERLVDELWTKSISKEVLALVTSDETIPYDGEVWERVLVNYYRAMNYIDLGQYEDALVECRKINHKLRVYADASDDPPTYRTDAFGQYLTAMLYEAGGELNDAWVSLRLAAEGYEHYAEVYGVGVPESLVRDLYRLGEMFGERDEVERLRESWPEVATPSAEEFRTRGEIILFWEEGFVPAKMQEEITIPILKDDDEGDADLAWTLSDRWNHPVHYEKKELDYLLRVALPVYPPPEPFERPGWAELSAGRNRERTELVEDLDGIARHGLDDRMGGIVFKTILRSLSKYGVTRLIEEKQGELAGKIANLLTATTEKADTRSWVTLPRAIHVARLLVEPGVHDVTLRCHSADGGLLETVEFEAIEIGASEVRFLSHRTF
jgi:hypothetical protein